MVLFENMRNIGWLAVLLILTGCGTTRMSDTSRTATEQLLLSDAIDRAINKIDFGVLRGESVYLDETPLSGVEDKNYIVSTLRQQILANGATLQDSRSDANMIVEARAGVVGTGRNDLLYGVPAINLPTIAPMPGVPTSLPEIPIVKRTDQQGIAKIAVFAYERETGEPIWQSGQSLASSNARNLWFVGAGPFQTGVLYDGEGERVKLQLAPNPIKALSNRLTGQRPPGPQPVDRLHVVREKHFRRTRPVVNAIDLERNQLARRVRPNPDRPTEPLPPVETADPLAGKGITQEQ